MEEQNSDKDSERKILIWLLLAALGIGGTNSFITFTRTDERYRLSDANRDRKLIELQLGAITQQLTVIAQIQAQQESRHDESIKELHRRIQEESREAEEDLKAHEDEKH
jgi:hypothetical protein